jgi:hypothetical protein
LPRHVDGGLVIELAGKLHVRVPSSVLVSVLVIVELPFDVIE